MNHPWAAAILSLFLAVLLLTDYRRLARLLAESVERFRGGGPGSPSHPLPADDSRILNRRRNRRAKAD